MSNLYHRSSLQKPSTVDDDVDMDSHIITCKDEEVELVSPEATEIYAMSLDPSYVHFLAQNLNNQGCCEIVKGNYDSAITKMKRALELTRIGLTNETWNREPCESKHCRLENILKTIDDDDIDIDTDNSDESGTEAQSSSGSLKRKRNENNSNNGDNDEGFIYRRPLFVSAHTIDHCHHMGTNLSFLVLFNIALCHHLKAIDMIPLLADTNEKIAALQQPLKLYELAYQLHFQCQENNKRSSNKTRKDHNRNLVNLRLMMLVTNNIGQIHRLAGNSMKHNQCLEHLLNALMFMNHNNSSESKNAILTRREKDGIFDNLSPILKTKVYAAAA